MICDRSCRRKALWGCLAVWLGSVAAGVLTAHWRGRPLVQWQGRDVILASLGMHWAVPSGWRATAGLPGADLTLVHAGREMKLTLNVFRAPRPAVTARQGLDRQLQSGGRSRGAGVHRLAGPSVGSLPAEGAQYFSDLRGARMGTQVLLLQRGVHMLCFVCTGGPADFGPGAPACDEALRNIRFAEPGPAFVAGIED